MTPGAVLMMLSITVLGGNASPEPIILPGLAVPDGVFDLREMDVHIHAGLERRELGAPASQPAPAPLNAWIDRQVADGRKVLLLLDHLELYRQTPDEYAAWAKKEGLPQSYPMGEAGHRALMADFDAAAAGRTDVVLFKGWEVGEFELDEGIEPAPMRLADVIGWHISPNRDEGPPDGRHLLKRIQQILDVQKQIPLPMIIFHPFTMRLERLQRDARNAGRDPKTIQADQYRFFKPDQQRQVAELLRGTSVYLEMSSSTAAYWKDPVVREALIADIKPLAQAGVQFTVSTDLHAAPENIKPFDPDLYCLPCGITPKNTNTLIRELLAIRAKRSLTPPKATAPASTP